MSSEAASPAPRPASGSGASITRAYCRLTLAFVVGLYLPWAADAADPWRHFGEAVHSWAILFFAPIAAWRLLRDALVRPGFRTGAPEAPKP